MNERQMDEATLVSALGRLPRERPLRRDLWPELAGRLQPRAAPRRRPWQWPALAASVALAFLAGVAVERRQPGPSPADVAPQAGEWRLPQVAAALEASEREYQAAFRAFVPVGLDPALLDAQAVTDIEGSWAQFRQAESALIEALRENPGNPFLAERLLGLRAQQLDFMQRLYVLDQTSRRET